jgi:hypothetical protein
MPGARPGLAALATAPNGGARLITIRFERIRRFFL